MRVIVMRGFTKVSADYCGLTHGYSCVGAMVLSIVLLLGTMITCAHKRHLNQFEMLSAQHGYEAEPVRRKLQFYAPHHTPCKHSSNM